MLEDGLACETVRTSMSSTSLKRKNGSAIDYHGREGFGDSMDILGFLGMTIIRLELEGVRRIRLELEGFDWS